MSNEEVIDPVDKALQNLDQGTVIVYRLSSAGLGSVAEINTQWSFDSVYDHIEILDIQRAIENKENKKSKVT